MAYHEQSFDQRYRTLGNEAESVFEQVNPFSTFDRMGWNRPRSSMSGMSDFVRAMPDYYSGGKVVEVMGMGKDDILKLKTSKYRALLDWNKHQPVALFVWHSYRQHWLLLDWEAIKNAVGKNRGSRTKQFHDGNEYVEIDWTMLEALSFWGGPFHAE